MPSLEGVDDNAPARGFGVRGRSARDRSPQLGESIGLDGQNTGIGGIGVRGYSTGLEGIGLDGYSKYSAGVSGKGATIGVVGYSNIGNGMYGYSSEANGVVGRSSAANGVVGLSYRGTGVYGSSYIGLTALLEGNVRITGNLTTTGTLQIGGGSFRIDHPLDPANKYLSHSFVESFTWHP